ncbi:MAG: ribosome recycling factor [Dehalococcoidales bacterium]|nr:ribosome recycling factor [Dehalococcoidales bacterium]
MVNEVFKTVEEKMRASVNVLKDQLASIRTGRASPALVEHIKADYAGTPMPLIQLANISAPEAGLLVISPWDRNSINSIEKAILKSDLGLNPSTDGNVIRIRIPPLSEERRQELTKVVHKRIEERKIIVRNLRHEAMAEMKNLEKNKEISQDDSKRAQEQLQKLTDRYIIEVEKIGKDKETELMES